MTEPYDLQIASGPACVIREKLPEGVAADPRGWLRTGPAMLADRGRMDGFFIAQLSRPLSPDDSAR